MSGTYHTIAKVGEIPEGEGRPFEVEGRMIAVILDRGGGKYHAIDDACPHQGAPLSDGLVEGGTITCAWHGWRFRLEDGLWIDSPKSKLQVGTYPVRVEGDEIQVMV